MWVCVKTMRPPPKKKRISVFVLQLEKGTLNKQTLTSQCAAPSRQCLPTVFSDECESNGNTRLGRTCGVVFYWSLAPSRKAKRALKAEGLKREF